MKPIPRVGSLFLSLAVLQTALAIQPPTNIVTRVGDQSIVLHWDPVTEAGFSGYRVYRSISNAGPFVAQNPNPVTSRGFCDLSVVNGQTYYYRVMALAGSAESEPSVTISATPRPFASDDDFLEYIQQVHFDYFWYLANPVNGLVPDRSANGSACSIAAVGFGLTAIGIGIDHGWITRAEGAARVRTTLKTFLTGPQGPGTSGVIGYKGWFYHFIDMNTGWRAGGELSSIDTVWLLSGMLYAKQYFNRTNADETAIRTMADAIFNRVDWNWMARGTDVVSMGWHPPSDFIEANWIGYNEGMMVYILGLGTATNPLPPTAWEKWTSGYNWGTYYGQSHVFFSPLFGHQWSHCWVDFRHIADAYMNSRSLTYFENSRRASLAQVAYCGAGPHVAYSTNVWGLTACDGPPGVGYSARGLPPGLDDGTIAPTAAGGSIPFTPEYSLPTLRYFYRQYRPRIWTAYGFRDAFNIEKQWYDPDTLGIDQGPIVLMIENYRNQRVWKLFMQNEEVKRGLQRAGFTPLASVPLNLTPATAPGTLNLAWEAAASRPYQVEYSPDLLAWGASPGYVQASNTGTFTWLDAGPPATPSAPGDAGRRFYRVFQIGTP